MRKFFRPIHTKIRDINIIKNNKEIKEPFLLNILKFAEKTNWIHANPSDIKITNKSKEFFYKNKEQELKIENILKYILNDNINSLIFIEGARGSGKTYIQNYLLNTKFEEFQKLKYTWVRVDYTKIYHYNSEKRKNEIDLFKYLYAQIVYVYFRYRKNDKIFYKLNHNKIEAILDDTEKKDYINGIVRVEKNNNSLKGKPFNHPKTKDIALKILEEIKNENLKIALFIDGIDNIDFAFSDRSKMYNEIKNLYMYNDKNNLFNKIILSLRNELGLAQHLNEIYQKKLQYNEALIYLKPPNYKEYMLDFFIKKFENEIKKNEIVYSTILIDNFKKLIENTNEIIKYELYNRLHLSKNKYIKVNKDEFDILEHLFQYDFRELKDTLIKTYIYLNEYIKNYNSYHTHKIDFDDVIEKRKYLILESFFKNGNRYAPDKRTKLFSPPYRNLGFTNLFNPTFIHTSSIVPPLFYPYLLKYLIKRNINLNNLEETINRFSKYIKDEYINILEANIEKLLEELLEYNYVEFDMNDNVSITEKGKIVLDVTFKDVYVLHSNIYYGMIYEDCRFNFMAYLPNGKFYIKRTIENIVKYIDFLERLQQNVLKGSNNINNNELAINFYTMELCSEYARLYLLENNSKFDIPDEIQNTTLKKLLNNFERFIDKTRDNSIRENIDWLAKYLYSYEEKTKFIFELLSIKKHNRKKKDYLEDIREYSTIKEFLEYEDNKTKIEELLDNYLKEPQKYSFIMEINNRYQEEIDSID